MLNNNQQQTQENTAETKHAVLSHEEQQLVARMKQPEAERSKLDQLMRKMSTTTFGWYGGW